MAIRSLSVPFGDGRCFAPQGMRIATAFGLAMTVVVGRWRGFAGVRWSFPCVLRNAGDGVPYGANRRATPPGVAGPHHKQKHQVRFSVSLRGA